MLPATCYVYRHGTCPQYYVITVACVSICQQTDVIGVNLTCSIYVPPQQCTCLPCYVTILSAECTHVLSDKLISSRHLDIHFVVIFLDKSGSIPA